MYHCAPEGYGKSYRPRGNKEKCLSERTSICKKTRSWTFRLEISLVEPSKHTCILWADKKMLLSANHAKPQKIQAPGGGRINLGSHDFHLKWEQIYRCFLQPVKQIFTCEPVFSRTPPLFFCSKKIKKCWLFWFCSSIINTGWRLMHNKILLLWKGPLIIPPPRRNTSTPED